MYCPNCLTALPQNATYCPNCVASQVTSPQAVAQSTQFPFPPSPASLQASSNEQLQLPGMLKLQSRTGASLQASSNVPLQAQGESVAIAIQEHVTDTTHEEREEREERKEEEENERLLVFSDGIIAFA